MNKLYTILAASLILAVNVNATTHILASGNLGTQLNSLTIADNDTLQIPTGVTVGLSNSETISANIVLDIYGALSFSGNNKTLTLSGGSIVNIWPNGSISGTSSSQSIMIGANRIFNGTTITNNGSNVLVASGLSNGFAAATPLPLQFLSFDAAVKGSSSVVLNWTAVNDGPATMFTVEQSTDGKSWNEVATVKATGGDHETISYTRELVAPMGVKTAMYRIVYMGTNAEDVVYSAIRSVSLGSVSNAPAAVISASGSEIKVRLTDVTADGSARVIVSSLDGKIVYNQVNTDEQASLTIPASIPGMYVVTVTDNSSFKIAQKIVVQ